MPSTVTDQRFDALLAQTKIRPNSKTARACRLVLVGGEKQAAAAQEIGVDVAAISRALAKLRPATRRGGVMSPRRLRPPTSPSFPQYSALEFSKRIASTNMRLDSRTVQAARMVLVDQTTVQSAAHRVVVDPTAVYRALKTITRAAASRACPCCGQPITSPSSGS